MYAEEEQVALGKGKPAFRAARRCEAGPAIAAVGASGRPEFPPGDLEGDVGHEPPEVFIIVRNGSVRSVFRVLVLGKRSGRSSRLTAGLGDASR
jgi:hypothetical protein